MVEPDNKFMRKKRKDSPIAAAFMGLIFFTIGSCFLYFKSLPDYRLSTESLNWPSVTGRVISSRVLEQTRSASGSNSRKRRTFFSPEVVFTYDISGQQMKSSRLKITELSSSSSSYAYEVTNRYPEGALVEVFYNPENPSYAILEKEFRPIERILLFFPLIFVFVGLFLIYKGLFNFGKSGGERKYLSKYDSYRHKS